jgi:alpha-L-fucosidase 2
MYASLVSHCVLVIDAGIWADGPMSAWSGDYHLNINLQMNYWAANSVSSRGSANGHHVLKPLLEGFIPALVDKEHGQHTATAVYGVKNKNAWVAHGFTDNSMTAHLLGDPQWGLCVTCGAWMALHAWDYVLYNGVSATDEDMKVLKDTVVPVLRGALLFFKGPLWGLLLLLF